MSLETLRAPEDSQGAEYFSLPRDYYLSDDWYQRDLERIFRKRWMFAGHSAQLSEPRSYITCEIGDDSVVVVRTDDGEVAAYHNICRHRGSRIAPERCGQLKGRLVCPYHAWSYDLSDGSLRSVPRKPADFDMSPYGLKPVWVEEWHGMLFINLAAEEPVSIAERFADLELGPWRLEETKVIRDSEFLLPVNWKLVAENFLECYHCALNHPELCTVFNPDQTAVSENRHVSAEGTQRETGNDSSPAVVPDTDDDYFAFANGSLLREGAVSYTMDGKLKVRKLLGGGEEPLGHAGLFSFPAFNFTLCPDYINTLTWKPVSATETIFRKTWAVHRDAVEGVDYDTDDVCALLDITVQEDRDLTVNSQLGIQSHAYVPGPYNTRFESGIINWMRLYHRIHAGDA